MDESRFGLNTVSLTVDDLAAVLPLVRDAGFGIVEFPLGQVRKLCAAGTTAGQVRAQLERLGLRCCGGFEHPLFSLGDADAVVASRERVVDSGRLVAELGGRAVVVGTDYVAWPDPKEIADPLGRIADNVRATAAALQPLGVDLLIEFNWGVVKSLLAAVEVIERSGAPNAGILFDPAHYHCTATKPEHLTPAVVRHIRRVHVNNMPAKPAELTNCNADRLLPGDPRGAYDLRELFGRLEAGGYRGLYVIEMFSAEVWALPPAEAIQRLRRAMLTLA